jgi:hypothetical protein
VTDKSERGETATDEHAMIEAAQPQRDRGRRRRSAANGRARRFLPEGFGAAEGLDPARTWSAKGLALLALTA